MPAQHGAPGARSGRTRSPRGKEGGEDRIASGLGLPRCDLLAGRGERVSCPGSLGLRSQERSLGVRAASKNRFHCFTKEAES